MFVNFRDKTTVVVHSADAFAPVALLLLKSLQLCEKPGITSKRFSSQREMLKAQNITIKTPLSYCSDEISANDINEKTENDIMISREHFVRLMPILAAATCDTKENVDQIVEAYHDLKEQSGWFSISNLTSCHFQPIEATKNIFEALTLILSSINASVINDLVSVTVLVSDMSQYADINSEYVQNFGLNPPVRVCVETAIDVPLTVSVVGFKKHDSFKNIENDNSSDTIKEKRRVMHVQSVSHWAAANIGPYSQAVEIDGILHIAGLIGLVGGSMELISGKTWLFESMLFLFISPFRVSYLPSPKYLVPRYT